MLHKFDLTIPASTPEGSPFELPVKITSGKVSQLVLSFPAGCEGLVGVRILLGLFQVWPLTTSDWLVGDDITFEYPTGFVLSSGGSRLRLLGYNEDTINDHTIGIHFTVETIEDAALQHIGIVTAQLPDEVMAEITKLTLLYENAFEFRQSFDETVVPLLRGIFERLDPKLASRIESLTLEEIAKL